jgi:TPR repeat protein
MARLLLHRIASLAIAGGLAFSATAQDIESTKRDAAAGDINAQFTLAEIYSLGRGVPDNVVKAEKWYRQAAEQGHVESQRELGRMYRWGDNDMIGGYVYVDPLKAIKWLKMAAGQGDSIAQLLLGSMYSDGEGVEENDATAIKWFRKSADSGLAEAKYKLGFMHLKGYGTEQSDVKAVKWYRSGAEQGHAMSQFVLGELYENGDLGLPENSIRAYAWFTVAEGQRNHYAGKFAKQRLVKTMSSAQIEQAEALSKVCLDSNYKDCD